MVRGRVQQTRDNSIRESLVNTDTYSRTIVDQCFTPDFDTALKLKMENDR